MAFFIWTEASGKILTLNNLRKRHIIVVDWYCMYKRCGETIDHLLLHCKVTKNGYRFSIFSGLNGSCRNGWWICWLVEEVSLETIAL